MSEERKDAVELADDLAKKTAQTVKTNVRAVTMNLDFDSEPNSFLVVLDELADDGL